VGQSKVQSHSVWNLARRQHGVVARRQLLELGFNGDAIQHRIETRRLHPLWRGTYAVGRPEVTRYGRWMAAVLACGEQAAVSHETGGALFEVCAEPPGEIHVSVLDGRRKRHPGIVTHRRSGLDHSFITEHRGIPVTDIVTVLVDLAGRLSAHDLEAAINAADRNDLINPERLRAEIDRRGPRRGTARLAGLLDRRTFTLTDSELERRFRPIAKAAGLPPPQTQVRINGYRVDFFWPELGLVVETDGLRYHRTAAQQTIDRLRDQAHIAAGLVPLRFTHAQIRYQPRHVQQTLAAVAARLRRNRHLD